MTQRKLPALPFALSFIGKWSLLSALVAALSGTASAFFLFALEQATRTRLAHPWLIWLLPLGALPLEWPICGWGRKLKAAIIC